MAQVIRQKEEERIRVLAWPTHSQKRIPPTEAADNMNIVLSGTTALRVRTAPSAADRQKPQQPQSWSFIKAHLKQSCHFSGQSQDTTPPAAKQGTRIFKNNKLESRRYPTKEVAYH